ncbi:MAG: cytochrome c-type biogenesis protein [Burkholderiales bacterium]
MNRPRVLGTSILLMVLLAPLPALPAEATPVAANRQVEERLNTIAAELRCLVCQNESLAGSRADLAMDLRREVRERIERGESDDLIKSFLVERYGDFILYRPPWKLTTLLLWLGPVLLLLFGLTLLYRQLRRRRVDATNPAVTDEELTEEERAKLTRLLASDLPNTEAPRQ